ncbi:MAG: UvrD-helicase domain-containing protein [Betaproteobacteria bacterium]|nr:UvrD-helicase domain-containing protein [Betaproteobacteria bacterium]
MLSRLNPAQREAVTYLDGPLLVLAGAGSGKTGVITHKIAHLVSACGLDPAHVAAITFTNKAAREMLTRVRARLPESSLASLQISTFHALGVRILRAEAAQLELKPRFSILDAADALGVLAEGSGETDKARLKSLLWRISAWKNALIAPQAAEHTAADEAERSAARHYAAYDRSLRAYQAVDFDDLIGLPVRLFDTDPQALARWQARLRYLLVDEYQDTNRCQYRLLRLLAGPRGAFTAVGDDDQAIYAWRGADVENLRLLQQDYPRLKVVKLEQNYRSMQRILRAANTLIAHNDKLFDKRLWSEHGQGDPIQATAMHNPDHEAESVVMKLSAHHFEHRGRWSDYAILYRANHQARAFEQHLRTHRIPYTISGGSSFFERAEIKDLTAYLRLIANHDDDPAFIRAITTPRRGIGPQTLEALGRYAGQRHLGLFAALFESGAASHVPPRQLDALQEFARFIHGLEYRVRSEPARELLQEMLRATGYEAWLFDHLEPREAEARWANVRDFVDWLGRKAEEDGKTLLDITQWLALLSRLDKDDADNDAVQLASLHAAKGLEFRHVFLVGVEEGILPHREAMDAGNVDEERRLMYVGITRARQSLFISHCRRRPQGRELRPCEPSRFIQEMTTDGSDDIRHAGEGHADTAPDRACVSARLAGMRALLSHKEQGRAAPGTPPPCGPDTPSHD